MRDAVRAGLVATFDEKLVDELLEAYEEAKRNFYLGGHRLSEVEGGRFCEAAFRMLQQAAFTKWDKLGKQIDTQKLIQRLESAAGPDDSIKLHIPRSLRVIYDIRNKRDAAHLADGIDPNVQDSTLVVSIMDWVLAEFVRLAHNVEPTQAQRMVEDLVTRAVPAIEDFDGFLKVLKRDLGTRDFCLLLLYQCGREGATFDQISAWVLPKMRANLRRTLDQLANDRAFVHRAGTVYKITGAGRREVEKRRLLEWDE